MNKVLELAREAGFTVGFSSAALPKHEKFYRLARADLEAEVAQLQHHVEQLKRVNALGEAMFNVQLRTDLSELEAENAKLRNNLSNATNILQSVLNGRTSPQLAQAVVNALNEALDAARAALGE